MINELNYILFLKCVEDSSRGLSSNLSRAAEEHIWLLAKSSLGGSRSFFPQKQAVQGTAETFIAQMWFFNP